MFRWCLNRWWVEIYEKQNSGRSRNKSGRSKRCRLFTTWASNTHQLFMLQRESQPSIKSTPPTCSVPKNISIVITRTSLPCLYPIPPPLLPLPPTHRPHSDNLRLVNTNRCLPHRLPSTKTFRPLVTPSTRTQSDCGFTHGAMATKSRRDRRENPQLNSVYTAEGTN